MFPLFFAQSSGTGIGEIISGIPHDAGAVIAYLLLGLVVFLIWFGSRKSTIEKYSAAAPDSTKPAGGRVKGEG